MKKNNSAIYTQLVTLTQEKENRHKLYGFVDPADIPALEFNKLSKIEFHSVLQSQPESIWHSNSPLIFQINEVNCEQTTELFNFINCVLVLTKNDIHITRRNFKKIMFLSDDSNNQYLFRFFDIYVVDKMHKLIEGLKLQEYRIYTFNNSTQTLKEVLFDEAR